MVVTAKQEFTITFTGEELAELKRHLANAHSYCVNNSNDFKERAKSEDKNKDYNRSLASKWEKDADEVLAFTSKLPNPWTSRS